MNLDIKDIWEEFHPNMKYLIIEQALKVKDLASIEILVNLNAITWFIEPTVLKKSDELPLDIYSESSKNNRIQLIINSNSQPAINCLNKYNKSLSDILDTYAKDPFPYEDLNSVLEENNFAFKETHIDDMIERNKAIIETCRKASVEHDKKNNHIQRAIYNQRLLEDSDLSIETSAAELADDLEPFAHLEQYSDNSIENKPEAVKTSLLTKRPISNDHTLPAQSRKRPANNSSNNLSHYGLFDVPSATREEYVNQTSFHSQQNNR